MDIRETLAALCGCDGPAGREGPVADLARSLLAPLVDEVYQDKYTYIYYKFGNVIGVRRCGRENAPRVAGRPLDEVGLVITGARRASSPSGRWGGSTPECSPTGRLTILSQPPRFGLVAVPPAPRAAGRGGGQEPPSVRPLDRRRPHPEGGGGPGGDLCRAPGSLPRLLGERVSAKALDDRAGFGALLRTAELLQGTDLDVDLYFMGSCREEVNGSGPHRGLCPGPPLLRGGGRHPRPHPGRPQGGDLPGQGRAPSSASAPTSPAG